jgi:hypothetical protein
MQTKLWSNLEQSFNENFRTSVLTPCDKMFQIQFTPLSHGMQRRKKRNLIGSSRFFIKNLEKVSNPPWITGDNNIN